MLTPEQRDEVVEAMTYMTGVRDALELHELRLDKFADAEADPSVPSGIDISDATMAISAARDSLASAIDFLDMFVKEGE